MSESHFHQLSTHDRSSSGGGDVKLHHALLEESGNGYKATGRSDEIFSSPAPLQAVGLQTNTYQRVETKSEKIARRKICENL